MAWLINALNYDYVHVFEPHSDVAAGLIRNVEVLSMQGMVRQVIESLQAPTFDQELLLLAPDAGASKRVSGILHHCLDRPCIGKLLPEMGQALKHRDPATGRLKVSFVSENVRGRRVLIVDDICDGGATFVELAHVLKQMEVKEIHLVVAHGIFSKSINPLVEAGISTIHASDSLHQSSITHRIRLNDHLSYWPMTST
jgi:ribose-phosphate pyrophosphokinase